MSKAKWPEEVPILEAGDICRGAYTRGRKHCLAGWAAAWFRDFDTRIEVFRLIRERIPIRGTIGGFNDAHPLDEVAQLWNDTMRDLGYTEVS